MEEKPKKPIKRKLRPRIYLSLPPDLHDEIKAYVDKNGLEMSKLMTKVIRAFLNAGKSTLEN